MLAVPGSASAHAVLTHTTPHQGASVDAAPRAVQFDFNEPVEVSFGAVRVFDSDGERVDRGDVSHPNGKQASVTVGVREGLGRGIYTGTYRVVSADGHPVSGGFSFGVGEPVARGRGRGAPDVAKLLARSDTGPVTEGAFGIVRGVHYAALLLVVGAVFFRLFVWPAQARARWPGRLLVVAAAVGLAAALAGIALQGALSAGISFFDALDSKVLDGTLSTRTGEAWLLRACAWFVAGAVLLVSQRPPGRVELTLVALPAAVLVAHSRTRGTPTRSHRGRCSSPPMSCTCSPQAPGSAASCCCSSPSGPAVTSPSTERGRPPRASPAWPCRRSPCS